MAKLYIKKNSIQLSNLIIVEGFWGSGKSSFIKNIIKKYNYTFIAEPNHLETKVKSNISNWYHKKHLKRHAEAMNQLKNGVSVIMERSIISNIAFNYAKTQKISQNSKNYLDKVTNINELMIIFLYSKENISEKDVSKIRDSSVKTEILNNKNFYKNYVYFYKKVLPSLINNKIIFVDNQGL